MKFYFTFPNKYPRCANNFVCFEGESEAEARSAMFAHFGDAWAFCYKEHELPKLQRYGFLMDTYIAIDCMKEDKADIAKQEAAMEDWGNHEPL